MPSAILQYQGLNAPIVLPTVYVTVKIGQTIILDQGVFISSEPYFQDQSLDITSFQIAGHVGYYASLLSQTNNIDTLAYFTNNGQRVYRTANGAPIVNGDVPVTTMLGSTPLRVTGVKIGQASVLYYARAGMYDGNWHESELTSGSNYGRIVVNVVPAVNLPPDYIENGFQYVNIGGLMTVLTVSTFTNLYHDPEGDPPYMLRCISLPVKGTLYLQGTPVIMNQEILFDKIAQGLLVYVGDGTAGVGQQDSFRFEVSDTGSKIFSTW